MPCSREPGCPSGPRPWARGGAAYPRRPSIAYLGAGRACLRVRGSPGDRPRVRVLPGLGGGPMSFPRARAQHRARRRPVAWTPRETHGQRETCSYGQRERILGSSALLQCSSAPSTVPWSWLRVRGAYLVSPWVLALLSSPCPRCPPHWTGSRHGGLRCSRQATRTSNAMTPVRHTACGDPVMRSAVRQGLSAIQGRRGVLRRGAIARCPAITCLPIELRSLS